MALEGISLFFEASAQGRVCIIWNNRKDLALLTSRERERCEDIPVSWILGRDRY